ncbi:MAG: Fic family protein [Bacteroides sp.]|nr:Fic family protein [Bacteroides sp.]
MIPIFNKEQQEKAAQLHCYLVRLQPFWDGNKRTSRMMESLVLIRDRSIIGINK